MKTQKQNPMRKYTSTFVAAAFGLVLMSFAPNSQLSSNKTLIRFFSSTPVEDIEATNTQSISTLNTENGKLVFSVPMQGFTFEKALMQEHFNEEKFLNTQEFPKAKYVGEITNIAAINFTKPGAYTAQVSGEMTIKGQPQTVSTTATITVTATGIQLETKFPLTLADYGISFKKGKPSKNIAKTIEVTAIAEYPIH